MAKHMARICLVPNSVLVPIIVALASIGTYALSNSMYEVVIMLVFGLLGYLMKIYGFEPAPLVLGVVLADILELKLQTDPDNRGDEGRSGTVLLLQAYRYRYCCCNSCFCPGTGNPENAG